MSKYLKLLPGLLVIVILALLYFEYSPVENILFPKCPLYATTGIYCPGCGSQRATHALLHLDIAGVLRSNVLFLPAVVVVLQHVFARFMRNYMQKPQYKSLLDNPKAAWIVLAVVIIFFVLRNIPFAPFSYLAPH